VHRVSSPIAALIEPIAPARLGRSFRWLLASAIVDNVGDGIVLSAGPLLIAALTRDPFLVSLAVLARVMPPLLFGLVAGTVADRIERRLIVIGVNVGRAVVLAVLATMIATGTASIAIVLAAIFILGTAETFADIGTSSLLPGSDSGCSRRPAHSEA
jgi:MFS family permease